MKWLNILGAQFLSLNHAAGSCERNLSTHKFIFNDLRRSLAAQTLERYVRLYRNMRLRDAIANRGRVAKKANAKEPKAYPVDKECWSSCAMNLIMMRVIG